MYVGFQKGRAGEGICCCFAGVSGVSIKRNRKTRVFHHSLAHPFENCRAKLNESELDLCR